MTAARSRVRWSWLAVPLLAIGLTAARSDAGPIEAREVSFESPGFRLVGTLTRRADGQARAGVVIVPGSGPLDRDGASRTVPSRPPVYRQWAERLGEAGFAVLRYDKRFLTHPGIDIAALDEEAQIADALSAVSFLRSASDETLPGHTLARNLAVARAVTAANRDAQLRELPGHDHLGMRPGEHEPSAEFMAVLLGWLGPAARTAPR
jgi:hypothetical protein